MAVFNKGILICLQMLFLLASCKGNPVSPEPSEKNESIDYEEDTTTFANPDRGFYMPKGWNSETDSPLNVKSLETIREFHNTSLIMAEYKFHGYQDKPLSDAWLSLISENFDVMREEGFRCILRFAYTDDTLQKPWDASEKMVLEHISQLKPLLQANADVISVLQAGFVGVWGEWYYSSNFGYPAADFEKRGKIMDALLDALPSSRMIAVRTPALKRGLLGISIGDTLTVANAYGGTPISRIAHHNDAFLSTYDDMGTYDDLKADKDYLEHDSRYLSMGGETDLLSSYSKKDNALDEMARFHWSYLNMDYHPDVISSWKKQNCFDEIARRLGYRFKLVKGEYTKSPEIGSDFDLSLEIANDGFAAPYNAHKVELIFKSVADNSEVVIDTDADPRFWFGGGKYTLSETVNLDGRFTTGNYQVYIALTDPENSLSGNPYYNIRFANKNVWDADEGYNLLFSIDIE